MDFKKYKGSEGGLSKILKLSIRYCSPQVISFKESHPLGIKGLVIKTSKDTNFIDAQIP